MPPRRPRAALYRWQAEVAAQLVRRPLLVAAQMGSGKTATFLTAAADGLAVRRFRRILLTAPRLILDTVWPAEAKVWQHTKHLRFDAAHRLSGTAREALWERTRSSAHACRPRRTPERRSCCARSTFARSGRSPTASPSSKA